MYVYIYIPDNNTLYGHLLSDDIFDNSLNWHGNFLHHHLCVLSCGAVHYSVLQRVAVFAVRCRVS